jgi:hypothetical protein
MRASYSYAEAAKVQMEIILLREDAERVQSPNVKIQILNQIAQKQGRLTFLKAKHMPHLTPGPLTQPEAPLKGKQRMAMGITKVKSKPSRTRRP